MNWFIADVCTQSVARLPHTHSSPSFLSCCTISIVSNKLCHCSHPSSGFKICFVFFFVSIYCCSCVLPYSVTFLNTLLHFNTFLGCLKLYLFFTTTTLFDLSNRCLNYPLNLKHSHPHFPLNPCQLVLLVFLLATTWIVQSFLWRILLNLLGLVHSLLIMGHRYYIHNITMHALVSSSTYYFHCWKLTTLQSA